MEREVRYFYQGVMLALIAFISINKALAADQKEWLSYKKACNQQWDYEQNGHHRHIGQAVCACLSDALAEYKASHTGDYRNTKDYETYYRQASQTCTINGVLANAASRAVYFNIYDEPTIENICESSWVGLMGSFRPVDPNFNSTKICQCASAKLTELVSNYDDLSPKQVRSQSLELVKKCDPNASLSIQQYSLFSQASAPQTSVAPSAAGKFTLEIKDDPKPKYNEIAKYLREDGRLKDIVNAMNQTLKIPHDIKIIVTTTDNGPYYSLSKKTIYLDYKMMDLQLKLYDEYHPKESPQNRRHYFNNVNRLFLYHELGHALIDTYHLPVLGQEEDAADALGAVISLKYLPKGYLVLVDAADFFNLYDKYEGTDASSYWDEHSLNKQRYYRLLCFAYGNKPGPVEQKIQYYYRSGLNSFLKDRSGYCHYGYNETYYSWILLLEPYLKTVPADATKDKAK